MKSLHQQKGVAAIFTVLIIPCIWGLFTLGVEGSRYLQDKAKLSDSLESAVLAVAANKEQSDDAVDINRNKKLVRDYLNYLNQDITNIEAVSIKKVSCEDAENQCGTPGVYDRSGMRFIQYEVDVRTQHTSWFPGSEHMLGFDEHVTMNTDAMARRYQQRALDIVFVADYSGSMKNDWNGNEKYKGVRKVVNKILDELGKYNALSSDEKNRAAFVGYNFYIRAKDKKNRNRYYEHTIYKEICVEQEDDECEKHDNIPDVNKTIDNIFTENKQKMSYGGDAKFNNIDFRDDFSFIKSEIKKFSPDGGTSSYEGIISASRMLNQSSPNVRKLMVILTDGEDWYKDDSELIYGVNTNVGICQPIRDHLNAKGVEFKMAVIGFDYDMNAHQGLKTCVGKDNVFKAENYDEIYNQILELIVEEIGHLHSGYKDPA
ncbi:pilus assembly protein TadG-related protein [Parasalinivibrio latis]|uniref:TadE/TadG family type IV pilus assembly protein n=1 Tax=Parasalinivibrio latis TaxID=2952610 RepID=UPI0030E279E2